VVGPAATFLRVGELHQLRDPLTREAKLYVFTGYLGGLEVWEEVATGFQIRLRRTDRIPLDMGRAGPPASP